MNSKSNEFCLLFLGAVLACAGCGKSSQSPQTQSAGREAENNATSPAGAKEAASADAVLRQLTDAVRKYSVEKRRTPADLNEVIAAGYLPVAPQAPPGKKFAINARREVVLVNN
jgi:hypothetical protein